ncbi:ABC transporter substrate-binding protein [Desulfovibrio inopinatus]|uniref:ABC transporter substrate-binding protein n=1 Tax=Desulfovibrio inopinatus TaxID=102109 RepID=UPI00068550A1|nr:ABC transporter substrate-binding protein [Desulfovibrio inopinatus]
MHCSRRFLLALCIFVLWNSLLVFGGTEVSAQNKVVRFGINTPLTGPYSVEGLDQMRAARMAVDEINRDGGLLGHRVELLSRDSASDVVVSELNIHELIDEGCVMILGGSSSDVAIVASTICQKRNVLFFGTLTYSTATTLEHGHRTSFRESNDAFMSANVMADWLRTNYSNKRFFFITADYTWGWTTEKSFRSVVGITDTATHRSALTPLGTTDFSEALELAASYHPDVLVLVLFGKDMVNALHQAKAMELGKTTQIIVPNLTLGMAERTGAESMEGVVGTLPWTWKIPYMLKSKRGIAFVEEFVQRYRRYPSSSAASAYSIIYEYKNAVVRTHSFQTQDVVRALEGWEYTLLKDKQIWRALDHQNVQTVYMVRGNPVHTVLADPLRLDYFEIIGSLSGEESVISEDEWKAMREQHGLAPHLEPFAEGF